MKKRSLTLIEVVIALGIASLLLAVLFPYLRDTIRFKKKLETEKAFVFAKTHVQERLANLFSKTTPSKTFKTVQEKDQPFKLNFEFNNGYDYEEAFSGYLMAHLFFDGGNLMLKIDGKEEAVREEILLEGLKSVDFIFSYATDDGKIEEQSSWEDEKPPLFFVMKISFPDGKEDGFYFRLHGAKRLSYPAKRLSPL